MFWLEKSPQEATIFQRLKIGGRLEAKSSLGRCIWFDLQYIFKSLKWLLIFKILEGSHEGPDF